jgi:hypothetical protein
VNAEEEKQIKLLLSEESSPAQQKAALTWLGNYLEEGDILNLPASKRTLDALKKYGLSSTADSGLKSKAKKMIKQYQR